MATQYKLTESLYAGIEAWQQGKATDTQLNAIYNYLRDYTGALLAQRQFAKHLVSNGTITDGTLWIHFTNKIKKYDRKRGSFSTFVYNQTRALIKNITRRELRRYENNELNRTAGKLYDENLNNGKYGFDYEQFDE